jgi:TRAP-type mannitol/chloroaromatic compound transport system permease small subunit
MKNPNPVAARIDGLNNTIGTLARWLTLAMVIVGAISALLRYVSKGLALSMNLTPLVEIQWYAFSLIFLLGAAYGVNHDVHVRVDVLYGRLRTKTRAWIDLVGTVLFVVPFCVVMLYLSLPAVRNSWVIKEMSPDPGGLPRYPIKAVIIISFALLLLQAGSQIIKQVIILRGDTNEAPTFGVPAEVDLAATDDVAAATSSGGHTEIGI